MTTVKTQVKREERRQRVLNTANDLSVYFAVAGGVVARQAQPGAIYGDYTITKIRPGGVIAASVIAVLLMTWLERRPGTNHKGRRARWIPRLFQAFSLGYLFLEAIPFVIQALEGMAP